MAERYYDPTSKTLAVKVRWKVASALDRLPFTCWAHLVSWALGSRRLIDLSGNQDDVRADRWCDPSESTWGSCYCGKSQIASPATPPTEGERHGS